MRWCVTLKPPDERDAAQQGARVRLGKRPVHVGDAAAGQAREVVVVAQIAVEAGVRAGQLLDQAQGDEQPQIAVHGTETHARQPAPHHLVHGLGSGMGVGTPDHLQHPRRRGPVSRSPTPRSAADAPLRVCAARPFSAMTVITILPVHPRAGGSRTRSEAPEAGGEVRTGRVWSLRSFPNETFYNCLAFAIHRSVSDVNTPNQPADDLRRTVAHGCAVSCSRSATGSGSTTS